MSWRVEVGDCRSVLAALPECSVDSIVTDPPYDLTAGKKGGTGPASVNLNSPAGRARIGTGFMGLAWDGTGVAFDVATWAACLRVLKPGGHLLAFGGTRTAHRMVCAIEDAGFEIRDGLGWVYLTGFPKSLDVSKAIDKAAGAVREVTNVKRAKVGFDVDGVGGGGFTRGTIEETAPATDDARKWDGWGTALKPAIEPICMARKPLDGTVAANVLEHGTGALNIGACRVGTDAITTNGAGAGAVPIIFSRQDFVGGTRIGRWPANVMLHEDVDLPELKRVFYVAKPSTREREAGFDALPLLGEVETRKTPGHEMVNRKEGSAGAENPRAGAGRQAQARGNTHATVKPLELMRELVRLVTPPGGTVLDPFTGSGTTGCAAVVEGFNFTGIELGADHAEIARTRIQHWQDNGVRT